MKCKLEWLTTEEGQITACPEDMPGITARVFVTGEEEAEFQLQDVVLPDDFEKNDTRTAAAAQEGRIHPTVAITAPIGPPTE